MSAEGSGIFNKLISIADKVKTDDVLRHGLLMVAFSLIAGLLNYLYQLSMGILLTPAQFGTLYTLLSLLVVISVVSRIFQTSVTKFASRFKVLNNLGGVNYLWRFFLRRTILLGAAAFLALSLLVTPISRFLNIDNNWYLIILFFSFVLALIIPVNYGVLRGLQRFLPLGFSMSLRALLRLVFSVVLVYLGFAIYGALLSLLISYLIVLIITLFFLKDLPASSQERVNVSDLRSYMGLAFLAITSYTMLTNVDIILAKHYLSPESAGNYSVISLLGKIARFAPAGIALAMFPKTSELFEAGGRYGAVLLKAVLLTLLLGGGIVILYWLFPESIMSFLFSGKYLFAVAHLFKYGLAMFFFALSWLLMNYFLSVNEMKVAYPFLGVALLQIFLINFFHSNIGQIVNVMLISGVLSLVLILPFFLKMKKWPYRGGIN